MRHRISCSTMSRIVDASAIDLRFPTSDQLDGSDAMNEAPDYSAAYLILRTSDDTAAGDAAEGHGFTFTIGRGNELVTAAVETMARRVVGRDVDEIAGDLGGFWRWLTSDSQWRWLGPDKGVIHLATAAVVNAVWDLVAKRAGKPVWRLGGGGCPPGIGRGQF